MCRGLISIIGGKLTTYRNLAEQTVDKLGRMLDRKLPKCRTHDTLLPGAYRLDDAREFLERAEFLSSRGVERLLDVYGGRSIDLLSFAKASPPLDKAIDTHKAILAAEVVFAIREEMAHTLIDIVHRRMMLGLAADQGRPHYEIIASIAADEFGWTDDERRLGLKELEDYSDSFGV